MMITINGLNINYTTEGTGRDILLIHGWGGCIDSWYPIKEHFKAKYRVTVLDLPGFGKSQIPTSPIGVLGFTEIIAGFIKQLDLKRPMVIGHSFGGSITVMLAVNFPDLIDRIILTDASGIRQTNIKNTLMFLIAKTGNLIFSLPYLNNYQETTKEIFYRKLGVNDYLNAGKMKDSFKFIIKEDLTPVLPKISVPTLIIWGEKDNSMPLWQGKIFYHSIPNSVMIIIPHTGHFAYLENPERFCEEVEKFINT